jgi:ADP-heptose:LPS heptosyltransferase
MPGTSPSVLIIRLDAIGDALALTPMLAALHARAIPADVVLQPANAAVFSSRAARRIVVSTFHLRDGDRANLSAIDALGEELASAGYSHVLVPTEDAAGYRLARATRANVRVGFTNSWGKPFKAMWSRTYLTHSVLRPAGLDRQAPHECEVLFKLAAPLLGDALPARDAALLRPLVIEREPEPDERVAVQITDKWERLGVAFDDVAELAGRIAGYGARFIASRAESAYADVLESATGIRVERFDDLATWKDAIAAAPALVAPDGGALHVAGMVGTPTVAVFPPQPRYDLQVARWAPWAAPHRIVKAEADWPRKASEALAQLL